MSVQVKRVCAMVGLLGWLAEAERCLIRSLPNRLEGWDCPGWRLRHRVSDSE